jgi:tRNA threonylcarbamoyladenosine biosynthesis protein TsaB
MRVLALDTTTRGGSVALIVDDRVVDERAGDESRTHAERLPGELTDLLSAHGLSTRDVDLFAVASGPGSFTGMRIGIATIQGLALVHGRPVVAVSALEALGQSCSAPPSPQRVAVWMNAHRGEVFSALYEVGDADLFERGRLVEIEGASVGDPAETLIRWATWLEGRDVAFIGDGAVLHAAIARPAASRIVEPPLLAAAIARMAARRARDGEATGAAGVQPLYVRRPDAELARDEKRRRDTGEVTTGGER